MFVATAGAAPHLDAPRLHRIPDPPQTVTLEAEAVTQTVTLESRQALKCVNYVVLHERIYKRSRVLVHAYARTCPWVPPVRAPVCCMPWKHVGENYVVEGVNAMMAVSGCGCGVACVRVVVPYGT